MPAPTALRTAIVGAGLMGRWHAASVRKIGGNVEVIADPDVDRAAALAKDHSGARVAASLPEAIADHRIDVVHVCTPPDGRESIIASAIHQHKHVLAEKPLASGAVRTAELYSLAAGCGVLLCPVHQFLFQPGTLRADAMRAEIGTIRQLSLVIATAGASNGDETAQDRLVFDILPHPLSLAERLLSGGVVSARWEARRSSAGECTIIGAAGEVSITISVSTHSRPTRNTLHLSGDSGSVHADLFHGYSVVERGSVSRAQKAARPFIVAGTSLLAASANLATRVVRAESAFPGLRELIERFYVAAARGGDPPISPREAIAVAASRDNIVRLLRLDGALA
ncbi:MAG TPA: Gfo/Idh/MocA family oxidoreductase [Gemmatimonadaceae bacterium]|nr:Gfo/Idh/MocA family oxidoreductase [Gemmatimonadaceae bacterium]